MTERLTLLEVCVIHTHNIFDEFLNEKKIDKNQIHRGFPFLIGGFTLQVIGVIVQLF